MTDWSRTPRVASLDCSLDFGDSFCIPSGGAAVKMRIASIAILVSLSLHVVSLGALMVVAWALRFCLLPESLPALLWCLCCVAPRLLLFLFLLFVDIMAAVVFVLVLCAIVPEPPPVWNAL